jgi:hypothetical protein
LENFGRKISTYFGGGGSQNPELDYDTSSRRNVAFTSIKLKVTDMKKSALKQAGKSQVIRIDDKIKIMDDLVKSGKITKVGGVQVLV